VGPSDVHRAQWRREIAAQSAWRSDRARRWLDHVGAVAAAAAVVDAVLTYLVLDGSVRLERNPLVAAAMRAIGIGPTLTVGALLRFGIVAALVFLATRAVRPAVRWFATGAIVAVALWWCAVVFANAATVARLA
jgi:hypothetical protein